MTVAPFHPPADQLQLLDVLDCLSDPIRLAIVVALAVHDRRAQDLCCGDFSALSTKSNLAYHFVKLREAGLVRMRLAGTRRYMRLRRSDLDARFPGLLEAVIKSAPTETAGFHHIHAARAAEADA